MKSELDKVLDDIPRASTLREGLGNGVKAYVYINDMGDLVIIMEDIGVLTLPEDHQGHLSADAVLD
jgi:hypothetical protein